MNRIARLLGFYVVTSTSLLLLITLSLALWSDGASISIPCDTRRAVDAPSCGRAELWTRRAVDAPDAQAIFGFLFLISALTQKISLYHFRSDQCRLFTGAILLPLHATRTDRRWDLPRKTAVSHACDFYRDIAQVGMLWAPATIDYHRCIRSATETILPPHSLLRRR